MTDVAPAAAGAFVQGATNSTTSTGENFIQVSMSSNVTQGDLLVLALGYLISGGTSFAVTDTLGDTWTDFGAQGPPVLSGYYLDVLWTVAQASGPVTVTVQFPAGVYPTYIRALLHEYNGYGSLDVSQYVTYSGSTASTSLTSTAANDLFFAWCTDGSGDVSYNPPLATRLTVTSEVTGDYLSSAAAGPVTVSCSTAGGGGGMIALAFKPLTVIDVGSVTMSGTAGLTTTGTPIDVGSVTMVAAAGMTTTGFLPQVVEGQVALTSSAALSALGVGYEFGAVQATAVSSLVVAASLAGETTFSGDSALSVDAEIVSSSLVELSAAAAMMVSAVVDHVMPSLEDQLAALAGQDPILLGATGYMDNVFTTRLVGDTE